MDILSRIPSWLSNKYLLSAAFFVVWMLFFDHNDLFVQHSRKAELNDLFNRVKPQAGDGRHERFKSTIDFDGPYHREQHGFATVSKE